MADELVYRLILDGAEESSPRPSRSSAPQQAAALPSRAAAGEFEPLQLAQKRLQAEKKALADVQKEDEQAQADARDPYAVARKLAERREEAEKVRLAGLANQRGTSIDAERLREEREKAEAAAGQARADADKARAEAEREKQRQQREREQTDPRAAAQAGLERERFAEQTRVMREAIKQGVAPEEVKAREEQDAARERAQEERKRADDQRKAFQQKVGAGVEVGGNFAAAGARGNVFGLAGAAGAAATLAGFPIAGAVVGALTHVAGALQSQSEEARKRALELSKYSPELRMAQAVNRIAEIGNDINLARKYGPQYAQQEYTLGRQEREIKRLEFEGDRMILPLINEFRKMGLEVRNWFYNNADTFLNMLIPGAGDVVKTIKRTLERQQMKDAEEAAERAKRLGALFGDVPGHLFVRGGFDWAKWNAGRPAARRPHFVKPGPFDKPIAGMKQA